VNKNNTTQAWHLSVENPENNSGDAAKLAFIKHVKIYDHPIE
jgi:hypothetical protein